MASDMRTETQYNNQRLNCGGPESFWTVTSGDSRTAVQGVSTTRRVTFTPGMGQAGLRLRRSSSS